MLKLNQIHKDKRGKIYLLKGDLKEHREITVFSTKKGFARGGCIHEFNGEINTVLEGKIRYTIGTKKVLLKKGQSIKIPKKTPHYFIALADSLVVEWGANPEEKIKKYKPFREIVDKINKKHR